MKHAIVSSVAVVLLLVCGPAFGQADDLSWWGQSGAVPEPAKDTRYEGYWWWPTEPVSNEGDAELWGNRGVVYGMYAPGVAEPAPPPPPPPTPAPPKPVPPAVPIEPPTVIRQVPVFSHVLFDFDKSVLKPAGKAETDKVSEWMGTYAQDTTVIEGHTCDIGTDEYNRALGQRRADAVRNYMIQSGIAATRVSTVSYGESQPAVPNDSPANRTLNRRAVFKITVVD